MKKSQPSKDFNWKGIDWGAVDREKAELIYSEAKAVKRDLVENLNALNGKAFNLLSYTLPILTLLSTLLLTKWEDVSNGVKTGGMVFLAALILASLSLIISLWTRKISNSASAPNAYFSNDYYKKSYTDIIKGNIIGATADIARNRQAEKTRGFWLKISFAALGAAVPAGLITFFIGLLL